MEFRPRALAYTALMFAVRMTLAHFSISLVMSLDATQVGKLCFHSCIGKTGIDFTVELSTIWTGVFLGAPKPPQKLAS
jgi:hypothetical protein